MDKKERLTSLILIIIFLLYISIMFPLMVLFQNPEYANSIVPISGLPQSTHYAIFIFTLPYILALLFIFLFPIIIIPIFVKLKNLILRNFENGYINVNLEITTINFKQYVKRSIYVALLSIGLLATFSTFLNLNQFVAQRQLEYLQEEGIPVQYSMDGFLAILIIFFPFVMGLWSISWVMEDLGFIHYKLPEEKINVLFEIEPMNLKYKQILKGYAGISAIIYYISVIIFYITNLKKGVIMDLIFLFAAIPLWVLMSFPFYFIYRTIFLKRLKFLRKELPECRTITKSEFEIK
ncbi:MAG: hypothetical protein ACFFAO_08790 [Candidatus Hermodarchaeota archaeon]